MNETFAQILLRFRKQARLTQKRLAEKSYISPEEISRLERDDTIKKAPAVIRHNTLEALANGLGLGEDSPDRRQFFEAAAERKRQRQRLRANDLESLLEPIPAKELHVGVYLSGTDDLSKPQVFTRMEQVADCYLWMLHEASKQKLDKFGEEEILVTTQGSSSLFVEPEQEDRWYHAINNAMERKWNVVSLYCLTGDLTRAFEVIREIRNLSVWPEQYISRVFRRMGELRPTYNVFIVPRVGALLSLSTHNPALVDTAFFYPAKDPESAPYIKSITDHFNLLFTETVQLARTYKRYSTEWEDTRTRIAQLEADEFMANNCHYSNTMPPSLFDEYLEKSLRREKIYSSMEFRRLKTHHIQRREAFERNVQSFKYRTIIPWRFFEEALGLSNDAPGECRYLMAYPSGPDQYITVDKRHAIKHIEYLIRDLRRYDNYEIAFIADDHPCAKYVLYTPWAVKGELAVGTAIFKESEDRKHRVFASELELTDPSIVRSYRQEFLNIWNEVTDPDKAKQKESIIRWLTNFLEEAKNQPESSCS